MKFNVAALAQAVQTALREDEAAFAGKMREAHDSASQELREWLDTYGEQWRAFARIVSRRLSKGQPITNEDLPVNDHRYTAVFRQSTRTPGDYRPDRELLSLQRVLATIADDTVTSAGLRELGVTTATMRRVVSALAPRTVAG